MSEPLIREEVERRINEFIATHEMVPRSRYDACNKDWLEAQERITQVQRAATEEIAVLTALVEQVRRYWKEEATLATERFHQLAERERHITWMQTVSTKQVEEIRGLRVQLAESEQWRSEMAQLATKNNLRNTGTDQFGEHL